MEIMSAAKSLLHVLRVFTRKAFIFGPYNRPVSLSLMSTKSQLLARLTEKSEELLNQQVTMEGESSAIYLAMASWCDMKGYTGAAAFLYQQSDEEREHMLKIVHYINDLDGHAHQPEITGVKQNFDSLRSIFEIALAQESRVTAAIHQIVDHCLVVKDFTTFNFLQWYVAEQREEETTIRRILDIFDITGEAGTGLYEIDRAIGKLAEKN